MARKVNDDAMLSRFKKHLEEADEYWSPIHAKAREYKRFAVKENGQWTEEEAQRMGEPISQTNRLLAYVNIVVNTAIQQDIGCIVEPVSEGASAQLALVRQSQVMTLWNKGNGQMASAYAFREQVWGSFGVMKQALSFADNSGFNKKINWEALPDPTMFRCDPSAKGPALSDMCFAIEEHTLSKKGFTRLYGDVDRLDRKTEAMFERGNKQLVYEYWVLHDAGYDLLLSEDGETIRGDEYKKLKEDERPGLKMDGAQQPITRRVDEPYVEQVLIGNDKVLKRTPWPGSRIPYKVAEGRVVVIEGQKSMQAMTTHAMNPQKELNFIKSQKQLMFSKGPQEIVFVPAEGSTAGLQKSLTEAARNGSQNIIVVPYKSITDDGKPIPPPTFKAQLLGDPILTQEEQFAINSIEACFGMSPNSWLQPNPAASGEAMKVRAAQGETSNFDFTKNWLVMMEESFRDALEIIPKLSISMQVKLAGGAQKERTVWVNNPTAALNGEMENFDLDTDEEYALTIKVAPSEKTMRDMAWDQMMAYFKVNPAAATVVPDLMVKMGTNHSQTEPMAARFKNLVPKEVLGEGPDPQVMAMQAQLQQAGTVIQGQQQQLQQAVEALRSLQQQLKLEKANKANEAVLKTLDARLKQLDIALAEQKVLAEQIKVAGEKLKLESQLFAPSPWAGVGGVAETSGI